MAIWSYRRGGKILDIKLGFSCNNACIHCVVDPVKQDLIDEEEHLDLTTPDIIGILDHAKKMRIQTIVLTGGEVTLRSDFQKIVEYAYKQGFDIIIQTNARKLTHKESCDFFIGISRILFVIALHANNAKTHDLITRKRGSFSETVNAINNLIKIKKDVTVKIVISNYNKKILFNTMKFCKKLDVKEVCFAFPHALGFPKERFLEIVPRYSEINNQIEKIASFSKSNNFMVTFETIPFCIAPTNEAFWRRNCDLFAKTDQYNTETNIEKGNYIGNQLLDWEDLRKEMKTKLKSCKKCSFYLICEGPWNEYVENYGFSDFNPISIDQIQHLIK